MLEKATARCAELQKQLEYYESLHPEMKQAYADFQAKNDQGDATSTCEPR
jgi:hypothetical protein